jgi:DNA-binding beta-propeller fold protein YncE
MRSDPDSGNDNDLCLMEIQSNNENPVSCKAEPKFTVARAIHWARDGKTIIAVGAKLSEANVVGIVRWTLKPGKDAFSADAKDWSAGKFVSDIDKPGKLVYDAAFSPDGKQLALVSNIGLSSFRLFIVPNTNKAKDFKPAPGKASQSRACKVSWRSDSQAVLVVQGDAFCQEEESSIVRVDIGASTRNERGLNATGDDPSFRPPVTGG